MMPGRREVLSGLLMGATGALLQACDRDAQSGGNSAGPAGQAPELARLYAAARAAGERRVVIYSSTVDTEFEPLWLAFQADYPELRVIYMMVASSQIIPRLSAESMSGHRMGDILLQPVDVMPALKTGKYLSRYRPTTSEGLDAALRDPDDYAQYVLYKLYGLAYNTERVREAELPRQFDDVFAPRWNSRFTFVRPLGPVTNTDAALATLHRDRLVSRAQLERLYQAGSFSFPESGISYVAQGRQDLNLWAYLPPLMRQQQLGAPLAIRFVPDFSTRVPYGLAIADAAPSPNAARLLSAWLFSPRGQQALAKLSYMQGTMPSAPRPAYLTQPFSAEAGFHVPSPPYTLLEELTAMKPLLADVFLKPKPK